MNVIRSPHFSRRQLLGASLGAATLTRLPHRATATEGTPIPAGTPEERTTQRGSLLSVTPLPELDAAQVTSYLDEFGLDSSRVRFGVAAHRIVYETIDPDGHPIIASGLAAPPNHDERELRLVSWLHGTRVYRGGVASVAEESDDRRFAFAFAGAGYAVSAPDHLGLGSGPGYHPWMHAGSLATASADALRATRVLAEQTDRLLDERILVTGFSEGGSAAMALGRILQDEATRT